MRPMRYFSLKRPQKGYSLPELLVVLAIIAIGSSMAVIAYSQSLKNGALRQEAEKIKSLIINARTQAIAEAAPAEIVFEIENGQIWINMLDSGATTITAPKTIAPVMINQDVVIEEVRVNSFSDIDDNTCAHEDPDDICDCRCAVFEPDGTNPLLVVNLRRRDADPDVDENYFSIRIWPSSSSAEVFPNERL